MTETTTPEQEIEKLKAERDTAQAACAEMRPLVEMLGWHGDGPKMSEVYYCPMCKAYGEDSDTLKHADDCKIKHALSTDCGKDHFHVRELENTTTLLRQISSELRRTHAAIAQSLWDEARRLTALKEGK